MTTEIDRSTFSGLIYPSDFDTEISNIVTNRSSYADRIAASWKFDNYCKSLLKKKIKDDEKK